MMTVMAAPHRQPQVAGRARVDEHNKKRIFHCFPHFFCVAQTLMATDVFRMVCKAVDLFQT